MSGTHILIDRETVETLVAVADASLQDLADGLADGTYEEDAIAGIKGDDIEAAIGTARSVLA